jgi:hypothetical protein
MNIKRGLFRLSIMLSTAWGLGFLIAFLNGELMILHLIYLVLGGWTFIWVCYWVMAGFFKDKSNSSES